MSRRGGLSHKFYKETHGIWGGLTNRDRLAIRRQRGIKIHQEEQSA